MRRSRGKQSMLLLAGWLFADMFVVLAVIFVASTAMSAPPPRVRPTPTPVIHELALKPSPIDFTITVNADLLIANDPGEFENARSQVLSQLHQQKATKDIAGIVLIFGGGSSSNDQAVAMERVLRSIGNQQHIVFNKRTVYRDFIDLPQSYGTINIDIYAFV